MVGVNVGNFSIHFSAEFWITCNSCNRTLFVQQYASEPYSICGRIVAVYTRCAALGDNMLRIFLKREILWLPVLAVFWTWRLNFSSGSNVMPRYL